MQITTNSTPVPVSIHFDDDEREMMDKMVDIMCEMYCWLKGRDIKHIISFDTGEVIESREFLRVRAILEGVLYYTEWTGER